MRDLVSQFGPLWGTLAVLGQILGFVIVLLISLAFLLLMDRKVWAAVQMRKGPNVVGAFGLLQSFADFFKFVFKEIVVPAGADRSLYLLAPLITLILAFVTWAVVPVAPVPMVPPVVPVAPAPVVVSPVVPVPVAPPVPLV